MGYVLGAQVAAKSLKELDRNQTADFVCIVSNQLQRHELWRDIELRLVFSGFKIKFVDALSNPDERVIQRRWFLDSYTKLHIWTLDEYEKIVYLDSDVLVLKSLEHLFSRDFALLAAAPDMLPPDKLQSGIMVIRPSRAVFDDMLDVLSRNHGEGVVSYDQGDQGFINYYFDEWYEMPASDRLPFVYNTLQTIVSLYPPAWNSIHRNQSIFVLHFSGDPEMKPWAAPQRVIAPELGLYIHIWNVQATLVNKQYLRSMGLEPPLGSSANDESLFESGNYSFDWDYARAVLKLADVSKIQKLFQKDVMSTYGRFKSRKAKRV